MTHRRGWAKVNAPVDAGLVPLVEALALFPGLETVESCEGDATRDPWVCFRFGAYWSDGWAPIAEFTLGFLGPALADGIRDGARVSLEMTTHRQVIANLTVRRVLLPSVVRLLRRAASAYRRQSSGCSGDTSGTSPRRC